MTDDQLIELINAVKSVRDGIEELSGKLDKIMEEIARVAGQGLRSR